MKTSLSIVILAAGAGTRMKSDTPKVLHTLCGKAMLSLILQQALELSDDIHIVLYHQAQKIEDMLRGEFGALLDSTLHLHTQDVEHFPGTGGALRGIESKHNRVLVLNGDMPLVRFSSLKALCARTESIVMSLLWLQNPDGYGRVLLDDKDCTQTQSAPKVLKIIEQKDATPQELEIQSVNAGVYVFDKEILARFIPRLSNANAQKEYYLTDVIALARDEGVAIGGVFVNESEYMGVNDKIHLSLAQEVLLGRLREQAMANGVKMDMPHTIYIESDVVFEGECVLENGVRICGKSLVRDSHIKAHSVIESSVVIKSDIGPMAHLRPNSYITDTHIGNFVELKSAKLEGVKAGHLSYLGDCEIGEGSNIGAGVITCNYDGKAKHKTSIGQNVFVGSDCQLIAPVCLESNTLIAAGSTITHNVPSGALAIARGKQHNKLGFFEKFFGKAKQSN
ncbi:bifunctional UDP-N-acetylglucosamine diphosphorylase/glucosamine-1-phosphate N-acetyltransferase GlmU [uncultured Helicobacter sp.]|uniref:bifunctional UDP-N-acetylglucosamine diphosphorylase/glucosamine-1-phosphate N-acetyltransferase GlmU n=1 Tax=uncultured Helicobacter sp. TaxID=175537 RepID=UPI001C3AA289|nr:bifunctional UDP-N-acetylglucosamine diphosphorylase/glucosamine-1-phosphate N-acetyltransferase GlmU [Candidatus Helicobacter avicola]